MPVDVEWQSIVRFPMPNKQKLVIKINPIKAIKLSDKPYASPIVVGFGW